MEHERERTDRGRAPGASPLITPAQSALTKPDPQIHIHSSPTRATSAITPTLQYRNAQRTGAHEHWPIDVVQTPSSTVHNSYQSQTQLSANAPTQTVVSPGMSALLSEQQSTIDALVRQVGIVLAQLSAAYLLLRRRQVAALRIALAREQHYMQGAARAQADVERRAENAEAEVRLRRGLRASDVRRVAFHQTSPSIRLLNCGRKSRS